MHADRRWRWRGGYIVFWAGVDLRKGSQAPSLLRSVVKERLDLEIFHRGRGDSAWWRQR